VAKQQGLFDIEGKDKVGQPEMSFSDPFLVAKVER
jgi:hypothetical protein